MQDDPKDVDKAIDEDLTLEGQDADGVAGGQKLQATAMPSAASAARPVATVASGARGARGIASKAKSVATKATRATRPS